MMLHDLTLIPWLQFALNWAIIIGLLAGLLLEQVYPRHQPARADPLAAGRDQQWSRWYNDAHNLLLWIVGVAILSLSLGGGLNGLLFALQQHQVGLLNLLALPWWLKAILGLLLLDFVEYLMHRLSHNVRWLWLLHAVHHSDTKLDVTANLRTHPLHLLLLVGFKVVAVIAIGLPLWVFLLKEIMTVVMGALHHAAIEWPAWIDRRLSWLLITPRGHWLHHSPDMPESNSNFGQVFSFWDRLFGTYSTPRAGQTRFGLAALSTRSWHSGWGMLMTPWRARNMGRL